MTFAPSFLNGRIRAIWEDLAQPTPPEPGAVSPVPAIVDRWLSRVAPATSSALSGVCLSMHGDIRIGRWRPFRADQILTPRGFIWAARAGRSLMTVRGHDMYFERAGEMDWRWLGVVPVMSQSDNDIARSAAGRFAGELLVFSPFNARSAMISWLETAPTTATATVPTVGLTHQVTMRFDSDATLLELFLPRWGNPDGNGFREETFTVVFDGEQQIDDTLLPESFVAGWGPTTDGWDDRAFFRCVIDDAGFF